MHCPFFGDPGHTSFEKKSPTPAARFYGVGDIAVKISLSNTLCSATLFMLIGLYNRETDIYIPSRKEKKSAFNVGRPRTCHV